MRRDVFQAIADPTRRAILSLIALQAMTPNALAEHFDSSRQAVSKHIKILTECQLVRQEQTGREIYSFQSRQNESSSRLVTTLPAALGKAPRSIRPCIKQLKK